MSDQHENAAPDGRGTDAQILKEREISRHAIVGALAAGYAGQQHPGADHWLAAAHDAGVKIRELEAAPSNPFNARCYVMSERHLSGYRLIVGFDSLSAADAAHDWVSKIPPLAGATNSAQKSPTSGMTLWERIQHVGGRQNAATYIEFGSVQAVQALVMQVLRDVGTSWELRPDQWSEVVAEELALLHLPCPNDPREAIKALVAAHTSIALNPDVSREAQALVERGRASANVLTSTEIERAAFETWCARECPAGDADAVQYQWVTSTDYEEIQPAALMAEIGHWRAQVQSLQAQLASSTANPAPALATQVIGCFDAAFAEGLQEALSETQDERLKDLVLRRLMHAMFAAQAPAHLATNVQRDADRYQALKDRHAYLMVVWLIGASGYSSHMAGAQIDAFADAAIQELAAHRALTPEQRLKEMEDQIAALRTAQGKGEQ
jgi:hypothetical protein